MTDAAEDVAPIQLSPARKAIVMLLLLVPTMMVLLDMTIANVALPHMQASLSATPDTISWVLTSYILMTAIMTPITGWLAGRFGRRTLFITATLGFTLSSALCGAANTLPLMVFARIVQGTCGAFLIPLSQAFLYDINNRTQLVRAITIWGVGIMLAPIVGPILGGWLTETYDWRWVFFVNVPIGLVAGIGGLFLLPKFTNFPRSLDKVGFVLLVVTLGALQLMLDRGTQQDWFNSIEIIVEAGLCVGGLWMLILHLRLSDHAILPRGLFQDRNFTACLALIFITGAVSMAASAMLAPMLQALYGYPVVTAGILMVPRAAGMLVPVMAASLLHRLFDARLLILVGLVFVAVSLWMMTGFNLAMGSGPVIWSGIVQGVGLGLVSMPLNILSVSTLAAEIRTDGTALYHLMRNLGGSIAIAVMSALLARNIQLNHAELGERLTSGDFPLPLSGLPSTAGMGRLLSMADLEVSRQAMMIGYIDDHWLLMWATIVMMPLVLILRPPPRSAASEPQPLSE